MSMAVSPSTEIPAKCNIWWYRDSVPRGSQHKAESVRLVRVDRSAFHHELHIFELFEFFQRIAADGHDVRPLPGFDGSQLVAPAKQFRGGGSASANCLQRRHAILHVVFEFFGLIQFFPVEAAGIRSEGNLDAFLDGFRKIFALEVKTFLPKALPFAASARREVHVGGNCRDPVSALLRRCVRERVRQTVAMLDSVHAGTQRGGDSLAADYL